jgi:hypothetical protein
MIGQTYNGHEAQDTEHRLAEMIGGSVQQADLHWGIVSCHNLIRLTLHNLVLCHFEHPAEVHQHIADNRISATYRCR